MKFQKSGQNKRSERKKEISQTSALPILTAKESASDNEATIKSSTPEAINLQELKELATKTSKECNWTKAQYHQVNTLFETISKYLAQGNLVQVELPLLKLIKLVDSFENESHSFTWHVCEILAKIYARQENHHKSLAMLTQSLTIKQAVLGEKDPSYLLTLVEKANCLQNLGYNERSKELFRQAKKLKSDIG